jgi:phage virion morphogenesis protein
MTGEESSPGAGFELKLEGSDEALQALGAAADRLDRPAPLFDLIGAMLVTSTRDRFERETDPEGTPWPPSIRARLEGGRTLFDSGQLANSLTHEADDQGVEVGTNVLYAAIHQFGGTIVPVSADALAFSIGGVPVFAQKVDIPRRAFLGLDAADRDAIIEIAEEFILAPIEGGGPAGGADAGR